MKRLSTCLAPILIVLLAVLQLPSAVSADTPVIPAAPTALQMSVAGKTQTLPAGSWINTGKVDLHFGVQVGAAPLTPQVEIVPSDTPFAGKATFSGQPMTASGTATVTVTGLQNRKSYHWEARVTDGQGNASGWVAFGGLTPNTTDIAVDQDPPSRPVIHSPTDPNQNRWYNTLVELLHWRARDPLSGVAGYSFVLERSAHVIPPGSVTAQTGAKISNLGNGIWFLALRAVDHAGNWSPTATFRLQIDREPARLIWLSPNRFSFNPFNGPATVRFRVSKSASVQLRLYRVGGSKPVAAYSFPWVPAGRSTSVTWSGKTRQGRPVPKGYYFFSAQLVDHANNLSRLNVGGIVVNPQAPVRSAAGPVVYAGAGKRIFVSLSHEALYAYDGDHLVLQTLVTTGNPSLPTPTGHYTVMEKIHPFEFISPWPPGSPFWYAPSWVQYAMLFRDGGYFLHDAPWRSAFGPGTNGPGQPGTNYGGSHGCVNIPPEAMLFLWNWTPIGTAVDVVP